MEHIPIVDLSKLIGSTPVSEHDFLFSANEIFKALSGIGFVYLSGHGVDQNLIDKAFSASRRFFELPQDSKDKSLKKIEKNYTGYFKPKHEIYERREMYDFCGDERFYPELCPEFGPALLELEEACKSLSKVVLRLLAAALNLDDRDYFVKRSSYLHSPGVNSKNNNTNFRTMYYPKVPGSIPAGSVRLKEHADYGILTILFQDNIGGLQVKSLNGKWIPANPIPGTIQINTGDILEFWTGGVLPATRHRVIIPEEEIKRNISRQSIVLFLNPDDDCIISPLTGNSKQYNPVTTKEHLEQKLASQYKNAY